MSKKTFFLNLRILNIRKNYKDLGFIVRRIMWKWNNIKGNVFGILKHDFQNENIIIDLLGDRFG